MQAHFWKQESPCLQAGEDVKIDPEIERLMLANKRFYLESDNELEASFLSIVTALRATQNHPEPYKIERKAEKISTLKKLGALMSADIKTVFDEIIADLESLESQS